MKDDRCVWFLQWALPQLHMCWPGFRKVRKQVCKRIDWRIKHLGFSDVEEYQAYLEAHADEWKELDSLCRITISRFNRDRGVFATLVEDVLPELASAVRERGDDTLRIWSAGCASGEEPYTLSVLWHTELQARFPDIKIEIIATDADPHMLNRAREARYEFGSLKELPEELRHRVFTRGDDTYSLRSKYSRNITFLEQDIREEQPEGLFDLVLCRNLAFTYFDDDVQRQLSRRIVGGMHDGAALAIGIHERLPERTKGLEPWFDNNRIYRKGKTGG